MFVSQYLFPALLLADTVPQTSGSGMLMYHLGAVAIFSAVGIVILGIGLYLIEKWTPYSVTEKIVDDNNTALAIVVASIVLGLSLIIAASILG
jgi:putative membrane protein